MKKLTNIYLSTRAELSLLKDKLYLLLDFLNFKREQTNTILNNILGIAHNELLDENELKIDISIDKENEGFYLLIEIFTSQAFLYVDKIKTQFVKVRFIDASKEHEERIQISILLANPDFYPTTKNLKYAEFILNQLSPDEIEKEFEDENNKLRQRLIKLGKEMANLETKLETRSMFLAYLSHEIRTPMNGILGFTDILLRERNESKQIDYLNKIKTSGNDLLNLVNDILDFSKLEAGKLTIEEVRFNLPKIMEEIKEHFSIQAENKGLDFIIDFQTSKNTFFIGDPLRLKQVLINLINNAIKFTNKGYVKVCIECTEEHEQFENLRFVVKDTGIGIRKEVIGTLFSPYIQADNNISRRFGGTGLGLFICKQLIELMGGIIEVKSEPGKGSEFSFVLPYKVDTNFDDKKIRLNFKGLTSLIVDPYQIGSEVISETLTRVGFESESILFSQDAIRLLEKKAVNNESVDLVIFNFDMPFGHNGAQAAKIIKQNHLLGDIKTIIMSAHNHDEELFDYKEYIDAFISKPVSQEYLINIISTLFATGIEKGEHIKTKHSNENELDLTGLKVLLAEDSEINQKLISELLTFKGAKLTIVNDGKKAIEIAKAKEFDVILMDINMPYTDGFEASLEINQKNKIVPIIAITAQEKEKNEQFKAGIVDYIIKPFKPKELYLKILKWTSGREKFEYNPEELVEYEYLGNNIHDLKLLGVNIDEGLKRVNGKINVYKSLLKNFRKNYLRLRNDFESAYNNGQINEAERLIHTIKGASGTIGALKLSILAKEFETNLKSGLDHRMSKKSFFYELEKLLHNLAYLNESEKGDNKKVMSEEEIKDVVTALKEANESLDYDIGRTVNIVDNLVKTSKNTQLSDELNKIANTVYEFQIDRIKSAINNFINQHKF
jgi:two-component system, sensor histidine kinase and response regulator